MVGWLVSVGWLVGWLVGCRRWLVGWLVGCRGWLVGWLVGWLAALAALVGWLVAWLVACALGALSGVSRANGLLPDRLEPTELPCERGAS